MARKKLHKASSKKAILDIIQKRFGKSSAITIGEKNKAAGQIKEYLKTGIDVLDNYVIKDEGGGLPIGRISEVFGAEGCGKTSLSWASIAAVQRAGGQGVVCDPEMSFDEDRAELFGCNLEDLIVEQPPHLEGAIEMWKDTMSAHHPDDGPLLIVHDSIASTKTKAGILVEAEGKEKVGEIPLLFSRELPKILPMLQKHRAHLQLINQIRTNIGVMFGNNITTPGGNAIKFYASLRLQFFGGKAIKNSKKEHLGKVVTILAIKNRMAAPYRKARVRFDYEIGYNNVYSTLEHAKRMDIITKRDKKRGNKGRDSLEDYQGALDLLGWEASAPPRLPTVSGEVEDEDDDD